MTYNEAINRWLTTWRQSTIPGYRYKIGKITIDLKENLLTVFNSNFADEDERVVPFQAEIK